MNGIVALILFITVLFANFAEAVAEGRGKAQAETLKKTKKDTQARRIQADGSEQWISASQLNKGDVVLVKAGELIPNDGEIIAGVASIDESAITGESAPVLKESGGDASVTGVRPSFPTGSRFESPGAGHSFRCTIALVEGATRQNTNEIKEHAVSLTLIFSSSLSHCIDRCIPALRFRSQR
ncbi:MAG: HAD-IC family P-type ATPase [Holdemania filiformis]